MQMQKPGAHFKASSAQEHNLEQEWTSKLKLKCSEKARLTAFLSARVYLGRYECACRMK